MEYITSKTYQSWERIGKPYNKENKLDTMVKCKCDRCVNGVYAAGVENGRIKPHPAYGGVCLRCGGSGYLEKEVRLYTPHEYEVMERNRKAAKERNDAARREQMEREYAHKKEVWLETHGFAEDGTSYIITGDSYSIKDQLKEAGFKYDTVLLWHRATPDGYEDRVVKINVNDFFEFSAWGEGHYLTGAKEKVERLIAGAGAESKSEWVGEAGDHIKDLHVTLIKKHYFEGRFGITNVLTFKDDDENIYTWFTTTTFQKEVNDSFNIKATIKGHDEYKGIKTTTITRVREV